MFRMSGTLYNNTRIVKSCVSRQSSVGTTRTERVFTALKEICEYMDLAVPIWLRSNISEFQKKSKTTFRSDSFVEQINFDYLMIEVIEE